MLHVPGERAACVRPPVGSSTSTCCGRRTSTCAASGKPRPAGVNESVCVSSRRQRPGTRRRDRRHGARRSPSRSARENVTVMAPSGEASSSVRRLDERLHALPSGEPAHPLGRGQPLPRARGGRRVTLTVPADAGRSRRRRSRRSCAAWEKPKRLRGPLRRGARRAAPAGRTRPSPACRPGTSSQRPRSLALGVTHVERRVGGVADEPAGPGRALHGDVDRERLAGRHRSARPELPVAKIDRDRLAAARVDGHLFDGCPHRPAARPRRARRDRRRGRPRARRAGPLRRRPHREGSRRAPTARACDATSVAVCG